MWRLLKKIRPERLFTYCRQHTWHLSLLLFILSFCILSHSNPSIHLSENSSKAQTYRVSTKQNGRGVLSLDLQYRHGQNTTLIIEPDSLVKKTCIQHVWVRSPQTNNMTGVNREPFCLATAFDLLPYLQEGMNQIILDIHSEAPEAVLYINPELFGAHWLSTIACLGLFIAAAFLVFGIGRKMELNAATASIAVAAMAYHAIWMHVRANLTYTPDIPGHIDYFSRKC